MSGPYLEKLNLLIREVKIFYIMNKEMTKKEKTKEKDLDSKSIT